jgi:IMP cyclohydrolase
MPPYKVESPINCNVDFDPVRLVDKTAIVTGGEHDQSYAAQLTMLIT